MTLTANAESYPDADRHSFDTGGRTLDVERRGRYWRLSFDGRVVDTRDLPGGVEELLGKGRETLPLVLRILEWASASD